jgi:DNA polymerase-3 subunit delta'
VTSFELLPEQAQAQRLLTAALEEGPGHAYLFHGPPGVGKRSAALAFAGELLGDPGRVERRAHPDLYVLEPLGEQVRIDAIRQLRRDLHLRPFEASRRVYLVLGADLMNEDAADALLKDLEEPPEYTVIVLTASRLGRLPETIRSRCQHVPFRRLSHHALEEHLTGRAPELDSETRAAIARVAAGRLDRAERLLDPSAAARRDTLIETARSVYRDERFDPAGAASTVLELGREAAARAREAAQAEAENSDLPQKELEQRLRRAARGAEREEIVEALDLLAGWYRDLLATACGAEGAALNSDRLADLHDDALLVAASSSATAAEAVAETRRRFELNLWAGLALEALFVELRLALEGGRL